MNLQDISDQNLTTLSHSLKVVMGNKNISGPNGNIGFSATRQLLCQAIFSKPYEEVKATILKGDDVVVESVVDNIQVPEVEDAWQYCLDTKDCPESEKHARLIKLSEYHKQNLDNDDYWGSDDEIMLGNFIYTELCMLFGFDINEHDEYGAFTIKATATEICDYNIEQLRKHAINKHIFADTEANDEIEKRVVVLTYGDEKILAVNGDYHTALCVGTDMEISQGVLYSQAYSIAKLTNDKPLEFSVPEIYDEWEYDDIINLAKLMGAFKSKCLFDEVEYAKKFLVSTTWDDGQTIEFLSHYNLDGEWESDIINDTEDADEAFDYIIWHHESQDGGFECMLSFKDVCNAEYLEHNKWKVGDWVITIIYV